MIMVSAFRFANIARKIIAVASLECLFALSSWIQSGANNSGLDGTAQDRDMSFKIRDFYDSIEAILL